MATLTSWSVRAAAGQESTFAAARRRPLLKHEEPRTFSRGSSPSRRRVENPPGDGGGQGACADHEHATPLRPRAVT